MARICFQFVGLNLFVQCGGSSIFLLGPNKVYLHKILKIYGYKRYCYMTESIVVFPPFGFS